MAAVVYQMKEKNVSLFSTLQKRKSVGFKTKVVPGSQTLSEPKMGNHVVQIALSDFNNSFSESQSGTTTRFGN